MKFMRIRISLGIFFQLKDHFGSILKILSWVQLLSIVFAALHAMIFIIYGYKRKIISAIYKIKNIIMINQIQEHRNLQHSLQADLITGWKPKLKIIGPMPLNYENPLIDKELKALLYQQSSFYSIIYLGPRPTSTFKLHELVAKTYKYKYMYMINNDFAHLKPFFKKFYSLFEPKIKRPFCGMNPNHFQKELMFNSCFQSGNLDCAIRIKKQQYDLILRIDSNTAGHILCYYFQVCNLENKAKNVKFNIVNLRKNKSAYYRGMRPFVKRQETPWSQQGSNLQLSQQVLSYQKQNFKIAMENDESNIILRKLSFQLSLKPNQIIQVAYSIPYTYTQLLQDIRLFKKKAEQIKQITMQVDMNYQSLSGLEVPLLKIKGRSIQSKGRYCAFIIARQHPGQSNSSYVLKGTIQQLLSGSNISLAVLNYYDFYIIPMVNPDGVIGGNFRTSLFGKDLNRLFKIKDTTLLPQIEMVKSICTQLSETYKKRFMLFLDYHGHSTRKNCFILGPGIFDANMLNDIRVLPKMMASYSQIFRYPSCSFRLQQNKKRTARALLGKFSGLSYTIETSNWSYYRKSTSTVQYFNAQIWQQLGSSLMQAIHNFLMQKIELKKKYEQKTLDLAQLKVKIKDKRLVESQIKNSKGITPLLHFKHKIRQKRAITQIRSQYNDDQQLFLNNANSLKEIPQQVAQANESDEMSQKGMDTDSSNQDMNQGDFKKYIKAASQMLIQFQKVYYGDSYRKGLSKYNIQNKSTKAVKNRKKGESIQACLKYKNIQIQKYDEEIRQMKKKSDNEGSFSRKHLNTIKSQIKFKIQPQKLKIKNHISFKQQKRKIGLWNQQNSKETLSPIQKPQKIQFQRFREKQRKKPFQPESKIQMKIRSRNIQFQRQTKQMYPININLPLIKGSKNNIIDQSPIMNTINHKSQYINNLISSYNINNNTILNSLRKSRLNLQ